MLLVGRFGEIERQHLEVRLAFENLADGAEVLVLSLALLEIEFEDQRGLADQVNRGEVRVDYRMGLRDEEDRQEDRDASQRSLRDHLALPCVSGA